MPGKMEDLKLKTMWWSVFNPYLAPKLLRKNMDFMGISIQQAQKKYPSLLYHPFKIEGLECEMIKPETPSRHTLVYIHGGGYFMGSIKSYRQFMSRLAYRLQMNVIIFNYRLAPEFPYPAPLEDCIRVLKRIATQNSQYYLAGDSAGGGLCFSSLYRLRKTDIPMPDKVFCISPWLDLSLTGYTVSKNRKKDVVFSPTHLKRFHTIYPGRATFENPEVSPIYGNLEGLPPISIHVGDQELLLSDSTRIFEKAKKTGADISLKIWPKMQHDWPIQQPRLRESREVVQAMKEFFTSNGNPNASYQ